MAQSSKTRRGMSPLKGLLGADAASSPGSNAGRRGLPAKPSPHAARLLTDKILALIKKINLLLCLLRTQKERMKTEPILTPVFPVPSLSFDTC